MQAFCQPTSPSRLIQTGAMNSGVMREWPSCRCSTRRAFSDNRGVSFCLRDVHVMHWGTEHGALACHREDLFSVQGLQAHCLQIGRHATAGDMSCSLTQDLHGGKDVAACWITSTSCDDFLAVECRNNHPRTPTESLHAKCVRELSSQ